MNLSQVQFSSEVFIYFSNKKIKTRIYATFLAQISENQDYFKTMIEKINSSLINIQSISEAIVNLVIFLIFSN